MSGHAELNELQATLSALPAAMPRARTHLLAELATGYAHAGLPNEGLEAVRETLHLTHSAEPIIRARGSGERGGPMPLFS